MLTATPASAWGEKGHYISSEAATLALPTDMPSFFYQAFPDLVWLGDDPDRWRGAGQSYDNVSPPDHYLDYEYVAALQLPPQRYRFIDQLYRTGTLRRYGISIGTVGFLPWRIAELSDRLTNEWRQWRFSIPESTERRLIQNDIIHDAGILGHYVADGANPLHATINYNGWVLPNPEHYANDCLIHARFETYFVSHAIDTADVVRKMTGPQLRTDYFGTTMEFLKRSNAQLETLYRLDRDGEFDTFRPAGPAAREFTAARMAAGAALLRDLWWSAWKNSANVPKRTPVE